MLVPVAGEAKGRVRAPLALGILGATVLAVVTGWLSAPMAFLFGAVAMVALRCVEIGQAYRSIDVRVYVMIAGVIPLGIAMEQSGTAKLLDDSLLPVVHEWQALPILLVMFTADALMTPVLSDRSEEHRV